MRSQISPPVHDSAMDSVHPFFLKRSPMSFSNFMANLFFPSPYPSPQWEKGKYEMDKTENDIGINSCHHVVQYHAKSSLQSSLQMADRKGFEYVKKTEEKKTDDDEENCFGNPEHGDEKTDHLINDDPLIIFFPKKYLGTF